MNVLVMASTIKMGGAKTIYNQFMSYLPDYIGSDKYLVYVSEKLDKPEIPNVEYVTNHIANGMKLLKYERKHLEEDLKKRGFKPNLIISLQNNGYKYIKDCKQIVYYHQAIPLYEGVYNPFRYLERILFYYKYIYPHLMKSTWTKDSIFAVQTPIVKERFSKTFGISMNRINTFFPDMEQINTSNVIPNDWGDDNYHFIFVGEGLKYRNEITLVKAIKTLYQINRSIAERIRIHVLSSKYKNRNVVPAIERYGLEKNFVFEGKVEHLKLLEYYKAATGLVLTSVIETVGLPLMEAAAFGIPVLSSDMDFARYVIGEYKGATFIEPYDGESWAIEIEKVCVENKQYPLFNPDQKSDWINFFNLISNIK
ncbi:glycosyltransferase [Bacteroides zhangwenhongii]|jgi:glycosyltransferase involved in cell wall biosynthesis|uniref:glycosyltransferase n=1 Tax=Bacteroides zhangwenhongii TaxID=2650157 RepID=UPI0022E3DC91|nr:glycosyltransferase [Bacteroides zhangwenhongii]